VPALDDLDLLVNRTSHAGDNPFRHPGPHLFVDDSLLVDDLLLLDDSLM
jgi:hypothetical protein